MEQNKNITAVEWLVEQLRKQNPLYTKNELIQIAKEMEEEQHENTWTDSRVECKGDDFIGKEKTFKQYYNETYGGDK